MLRRNLAHNSCVNTPSACVAHLLVNKGRALVFDSYPEMKAATDDPDLDVTANGVPMLRNVGLKGAGDAQMGNGRSRSS